jgi:hypothetical protein
MLTIDMRRRSLLDRGSWREDEDTFGGNGFCVNAAGEVTALR